MADPIDHPLTLDLREATIHYCQRCDDQRLMEPWGWSARCPECGAVDDLAVRAPLIVVLGASGAGKSAVLPHLVRALAGEAVVFDGDWLIDPLARHPGTAEVDWPTLRDLWLHVAHGVAQNGLPTVLLAPFLPAQLDELPGRRWIGSLQVVVLDCADDERRRRLEARPAWRAHDIDEQITFGRRLRRRPGPIVDTTTGTPIEAAARIARCVRDLLIGDPH